MSDDQTLPVGQRWPKTYSFHWVLTKFGCSLENVIYKLIKDSLLLIKWFLNNKMKANPEKFQAIAVGEQTRNEDITCNLENNVIKCEENVKLLGVTLDFQLNFNTHVSNICKRASNN